MLRPLLWAALLPAACLLGGCPERSAVRNSDRTIDADVLDSPGPPAKIILLIGDGMGTGQRESASYFKAGQPEALQLYGLPVQGTISTSSPSGTTDSAAAATAMATGEFTYNGRVGQDLDGRPVQNLVELAKRYGLATGLVTTTRLAHATPASFVAHADSRNLYPEIAEQMSAIAPDLMLGGGRLDFEERADGKALSESLRSRGYTIVRSASELAEDKGRSNQMLGLFADGQIPYASSRTEEDDLPTLSEMALAAVERLDRDPEGFFLMVESGRIDHAGHSNLIEESIGETLALDDATQALVDWAGSRDDVTIIVTADHETGGLTVEEGSEAGEIPRVSWRWGSHTNAMIKLFAQGPGTSVFDGAIRDHRWIHSSLADLIRGTDTTPPDAILPDGNLEDLTGAIAVQSRNNPADAATRLTRLRAGSDERGLGIGLEGLFRWDLGALLILIDVDYGAATGLTTLDSISDQEGAANVFLSGLQTPAPQDPGFGADLAFLSVHGEAPKLETMPDTSGLRGLRPPYGATSALGKIALATNFSDNARSRGGTTVVEADRGLELYIRWQELYPGETSPPPGSQIAVWAIQVNEDGSLSNQSLPPWQDAGSSIAPTPLVLGL